MSNCDLLKELKLLIVDRYPLGSQFDILLFMRDGGVIVIRLSDIEFGLIWVDVCEGVIRVSLKNGYFSSNDFMRFPLADAGCFEALVSTISSFLNEFGGQ